MNNLQRAIDSDYGTLALGPEPTGTGWQAPNPRQKPKGGGGICKHTIKGITYYRATITINKKRYLKDCRTEELAQTFLDNVIARYKRLRPGIKYLNENENENED